MEFNTIDEIIYRSRHFDQNNKDLIKNEGVVFTGEIICDHIITLIDPKIEETICEPSVGRGAFVFSLLEKFRKDGYEISQIVNFIEKNLFCYDINPEFISELKSMIRSYVMILGYDRELNLYNILCEDFLIQKKSWDVIIGNPPYVRIQNMNKDYLDLLKNDLKSITLGNVDLYYAFLEKSLMVSKRVGFIIPNSFIKTKSGKFLREIIINSIRYIYDFCSDKVWEGISTYTCIVICDNKKFDEITYETKKEKISKNKSSLSSTKWIFIDKEYGNTNLYDMIEYCSGGLATIKDVVYKIDKNDNDFCYKGNNAIEFGICKKVIKATKDRDFKSHRWIIYPYDNNSKILEESFIEKKYPLAYKYLLMSKNDLNTRDKGKVGKYDSWYAYGRRQGLLKNRIGKKIILPLTFLKSRGIHYIEIPDNEDCLVLSGILVIIKEEYFELFIETISSENFYQYCESNNKILKDKNMSDDIWLSITTTTLRNYKY